MPRKFKFHENVTRKKGTLQERPMYIYNSISFISA